MSSYVRVAVIVLIVAALVTPMAGCVERPSRDLEIRDWHDLDAVRRNMVSSHRLMNDLDSTTRGYQKLAGPTANGGKGWEPIGTQAWRFTGTLDGQGHDIRDLYIDRPGEDHVGLFGYVRSEGVIRRVGVVDAAVTGGSHVGSLVGENRGAVQHSYGTGSVAGNGWDVGGLVGSNLKPGGDWGTVTNSHFSGSVRGYSSVGGLVGSNTRGSVRDSSADGSVTGSTWDVGGLVGYNHGTVRDSHFSGTVTGYRHVGGLVGDNRGTLSNSDASGDVTGADGVGGLVGYNYGGSVSNCYSAGNVIAEWRNVGGLVGYNGAGSGVTLCHSAGSVSGHEYVGGLVGLNAGNITNCYANSSATADNSVGGLVGGNRGTVRNSYAGGKVTGDQYVGGLVARSHDGTVSNSFWDLETSGIEESDGGTGKTTSEMMDIATFTDTETEGLDEPWDMVAVADADQRNPAHIWNIVDGETYPFLSWQDI